MIFSLVFMIPCSSRFVYHVCFLVCSSFLSFHFLNLVSKHKIQALGDLYSPKVGLTHVTICLALMVYSVKLLVAFTCLVSLSIYSLFHDLLYMVALPIMLQLSTHNILPHDRSLSTPSSSPAAVRFHILLPWFFPLQDLKVRQ